MLWTESIVKDKGICEVRYDTGAPAWKCRTRTCHPREIQQTKQALKLDIQQADPEAKFE